MKILLISNMYPSKKDKTYGTFVKCFQDGLLQYNKTIKFQLVVIKGRSNLLLVKLFKYFVFYSRIIIHILFSKYDLVYVHQITHSSPILLLMCKLKSFKLIMNIHGGDLITRKRISTLLFHFSSRLLRKAELIITPSEYFKKILIQKQPFISPDRVFISPSGGIDTNVFKYFNTHILSHKIIYISRIDSGKGWDTLLYAMNKIKNKEGLKIKCYIAGNGTQVEQMKTLINTLELNDSCIYIGALCHKEMTEYYNKVDCLIFPTQLQESLGLVGIESLSCGCPVIGSNIGCLPEYIINNVDGYLFTPGNADDLANCINKLYALTAEDYLTLRKNAHQISLKYNSYQIAKEMYEKLYSLI